MANRSDPSDRRERERCDDEAAAKRMNGTGAEEGLYGGAVGAMSGSSETESVLEE